MKLVLKVCLTMISFFVLNGCSQDDGEESIKPQSDSINKVLALGASRVEGNRPNYESFRYELWKDLIADGRTFDFIGTQSDDAAYPTFDDTSFDVDHEGRGGWTSGQILAGITDWLQQIGTPDIVLFSSPGGNDALQNLEYEDAIANINGIIDALQTANPNITIIIEELAPGRSDIMTPTISSFFTNMIQDVSDIAIEQSTSTSKVITVDMHTGFTDALLADEVHYNEAGAQFVAERYFDVLVDVME